MDLQRKSSHISLGGNTILLTGTSYIDTTAVSILAIMNTPTSGNSTQILARNTTTGVIAYTTVSGGGSTSPAGSDTQIQFNEIEHRRWRLQYLKT